VELPIKRRKEVFNVNVTYQRAKASQSSNDDKSSREKVLQQKAFEIFVARALVRT
jgi:hypothetical protein